MTELIDLFKTNKKVALKTLAIGAILSYGFYKIGFKDGAKIVYLINYKS